MNLAKTINSMWIATKRKLNKRKIGKKREEKTYKHNLLRRKNKIFMTIANDFVGLNILSTLWSSHFTRWFFSRCVVELCRSLCRRVICITFRDCSVLFFLNSGLWFVCWRLVSANVLCDSTNAVIPSCLHSFPSSEMYLNRQEEFIINIMQTMSEVLETHIGW